MKRDMHTLLSEQRVHAIVQAALDIAHGVTDESFTDAEMSTVARALESFALYQTDLNARSILVIIRNAVVSHHRGKGA